MTPSPPYKLNKKNRRFGTGERPLFVSSSIDVSFNLFFRMCCWHSYTFLFFASTAFFRVGLIAHIPSYKSLPLPLLLCHRPCRLRIFQPCLATFALLWTRRKLELHFRGVSWAEKLKPNFALLAWRRQFTHFAAGVLKKNTFPPASCGSLKPGKLASKYCSFQNQNVFVRKSLD